MKFIALNSMNDPKIVCYINIEYIVAISEYKTGSAIVTLESPDSYEVMQTPNDIFRLIRNPF